MAMSTQLSKTGSIPKLSGLTVPSYDNLLKTNTTQVSNPISGKGQSSVISVPKNYTTPPGTIGGFDKEPSIGTHPGLINPTPKTAVKSTSITHPDGTTITNTFHPEPTPTLPPKNSDGSYTSTGGAVINADGSVKTSAAQPAPLTTSGQIPGVLNSGNQTQNESQTQSGLLQSGQATPLEQKYIDEVQRAQGLKNVGQLGQYAEAGLYSGNPTPPTGLINQPDLAGRAGADNGLYNSLANIYGSQATAGLTAANTIAGRGEQAAQGAYTGAQNQANRATGANENVLGAVAPLANTPYALNPATGTYAGSGNSAGTSAANAVTNAGTLAGLQSGAATAAATNGNIASQQATQIAGYTSALQQGQNLQSQLSDLITTFGLNPNDLNVANSGIQKIAQNTSDPHYKQLQNYVNDIANTYAQILTPPGGSSTDTSRGIATSMLDATASGTSILDTMKSLDQAAQAKIAGVSTTGNTTGTASSSTSGFGWNG